jgi:glycosyltransferase involved in cell wall biosynthesis
VSSSPTPVVIVGVPVWRGATFVGETLRSILAQDGATFRVVISVDGADEASAAACEPFLADARVKLVVQSSRLGWVRNSAAVLGAAAAEGADYACIQPQDDIMEEDYLSSLVAVAEAAPHAAAVYSDIRAFGDKDFLLHQPSVIGSPLARLATLLIDHFNAIAFRGLTRMSALRAVEPISGNPSDDFAADTVWMARLATVGDLICVPRPLYRKRYHSGNTHGEWDCWPRERQIAAWTRHCLDMLAEALKTAKDAAARNLLVEASRVRLFRTGGTLMTFHNVMSALTAEERARVLLEFDPAVSHLCQSAARVAELRREARPAWLRLASPLRWRWFNDPG